MPMPKYKTVALNDYIFNENHVAVLINDGLLNGSSNIGPTHWVLWEGKVVSKETNLPVTIKTSETALVDLDLYSWGDVKSMSAFSGNGPITLNKFCSYIYGAVVFEKIR